MAKKNRSLRTPKHKQMLAEFCAAKADGVLPFSVGNVIKEGSWADILRESKNKKMWKFDRKQERKFKYNHLTGWKK